MVPPLVGVKRGVRVHVSKEREMKKALKELKITHQSFHLVSERTISRVIPGSNFTFITYDVHSYPLCFHTIVEKRCKR